MVLVPIHIMQKKTDSYIIDTCKLTDSNTYQPGALMYAGFKRVDKTQWTDKLFPTQREADDFVREQLKESGLQEAGNEGELRRAA